jgi:hypothetical protein
MAIAFKKAAKVCPEKANQIYKKKRKMVKAKRHHKAGPPPPPPDGPPRAPTWSAATKKDSDFWSKIPSGKSKHFNKGY